MNNQESWQMFFGEEYLFFSEEILTNDRTTREINDLLKLLPLPQGTKILDLGSGQGRTSVPLAEKGFDVTAFDQSSLLLEEAQSRAMKAGVGINFICGDMRTMSFSEEFDVVLNLGTAFGYVQDEGENHTIIKKIAQALKPGGLFILDTENREFKLKNGTGVSHHVMKDIAVESKREFDMMSSRWKEKLSWVKEGATKEFLLDIRLYSATELITMVIEAGMHVTGVFGGLQLSEITVNSPRTVLLSAKANIGDKKFGF
jgi:2-polyprenyl-3-methyl-5-hydroxy-6-metoxy-1,4-benzoquinol methylase